MPSRRIRVILVQVVLFGCLAGLLAIADRAPLHSDKRHPDVTIESDFYRYYNGVVERTLPGPYPYRVLVPGVIWILHGAAPFVSELTIDALFKVVLLWTIQIVFFQYVKRFLDPLPALAGVLWLDVLIGFSLAYVQGPSTSETMDLLNLLVCLLFLFWLEEQNWLKLVLLMAAGMVNRETPLLLVPLVLIYDTWSKRGFKRTIVLGSTGSVVYLVIRVLIQPAGGEWVTTVGVPYNLPGIDPGTSERALVGLVHILLLLGPLLVFAFMWFKEKPLPLRAAISTAPLLILVHYIFGTAIESRLWFPLYVFLIPPALLTLRTLVAPASGSDH